MTPPRKATRVRRRRYGGWLLRSIFFASLALGVVPILCAGTLPLSSAASPVSSELVAPAPLSVLPFAAHSAWLDTGVPVGDSAPGSGHRPGFSVTAPVRPAAASFAPITVDIVSGVGAMNGTTYRLDINVAPTSCGAITVGSVLAATGTSLSLSPGQYAIDAPTCSGHSFSSWGLSGGVSVQDWGQASASMDFSGPGNLTANYAESGTPGPFGISGLVGLQVFRVGSLIAVPVAAVWCLAYIGHRRATRMASTEPPTAP
jgi:hypothetical protein